MTSSIPDRRCAAGWTGSKLSISIAPLCDSMAGMRWLPHDYEPASMPVCHRLSSVSTRGRRQCYQPPASRVACGCRLVPCYERQSVLTDAAELRRAFRTPVFLTASTGYQVGPDNDEHI